MFKLQFIDSHNYNNNCYCSQDFRYQCDDQTNDKDEYGLKLYYTSSIMSILITFYAYLSRLG